MPDAPSEPWRGRFFVESEDGGWCVFDIHDQGCLGGFTSQTEARQYATFCRAYVRRHGAASLYCAPTDIDQAPDRAHIARLRDEASPP